MIEAIPDGDLISAGLKVLPRLKRKKVKLDTRLVPEDSEIRRVTEQTERQERLKKLTQGEELTLEKLDDEDNVIEKKITQRAYKDIQGRSKYQHEWSKPEKKAVQVRPIQHHKQTKPKKKPQKIHMSRHEINTPIGSFGIKSMSTTVEVQMGDKTYEKPVTSFERIDPFSRTMKHIGDIVKNDQHVEEVD